MSETLSDSLTILGQIPCTFDLPQLIKRLHVQPGSDDAQQLEHLVGEAQALARPKAMTRVAYVDCLGEDSVQIEGIAFNSRVLRVNLDHAHRVFAYVVTCGQELYTWSKQFDDIVLQFWAEAIQEAALRQAGKALREYIEERYQPGKTSTMAPGSLGDWPIKEQRPLFDLLGNPYEAIGVELSESCLMIPAKSISGIRFPTEIDFESCQLCPRPECPGRRASYNQALYASRYGLNGPAH